MLAAQLLEYGLVGGDLGRSQAGFDVLENHLDFIEFLEHRGGCNRTKDQYVRLLPYFFMKRSIRPSVSTTFCLPV